MLKLGIIGTNWITQQFIDAAAASGEWQLTSVYSRHAETRRLLPPRIMPMRLLRI